MRVFLIAQAIVAVLLTVSILLQNRGSGLGSAFGSDFGGYYTKRGFERFLVYATIGLAVLFFALAMVNVRLSTTSAAGL
ncbi:MAG: preprotein translocase subunit SecG [Candidatus Moraniibacteriota bacterium]